MSILRILRTTIRWALSLALLAASLVLVVGPGPAFAAGPEVVASISADSATVAGGDIGYVIEATNPSQTGAVDYYNIGYRVVLPPGVTYVPGSTDPAMIGDPDITVVGGQQILTWTNVSDLPITGNEQIAFEATPDPDDYPVGSVVSASLDVYAQEDPRLVPTFDSNGDPVAGSYSASDSAGPASTDIVAIDVTKTENSAEGELVRGIHDHPTQYAIRVENTSAAATNNLVVDDYLPAQLEFLACNNTDNSSQEEYPGSGPLGTAPVSGCTAPDLVETVSLSAGNPQGLSPGIYTHVQWDLASIAAGGIETIRYGAGIPQRANRLFSSPVPSPSSGDQAANLDNNTGEDTSETDSEPQLINTVQVSGTYSGPVTGGADPNLLVSSAASVNAEDFSVEKNVSPTNFEAGEIATYTIAVRASEYASLSGITLTDSLPVGLCPLSSDGTPNTCSGADPSGGSYSSVTSGADGRTIVFDIPDLQPNAEHVLTYSALMESSYPGGEPTASGDSFLNTVTGSATSTPDPATNPPDPSPRVVSDDSEALLNSLDPVLTKSIKLNESNYGCSGGTYQSDPADEDVVFTQGSRLCFKIRVDFPTGTSTRNPVIKDFLPAGTSYESGSATYAAGSVNVVSFDDTDAPLAWQLGTPTGADRYADPGSFFEVTFSAIVDQASGAEGPGITGNLVKMTWATSGSSTGSLRDHVDFLRASPPPLVLAKTAELNSNNLANNATVNGGDEVDYTVTLSNEGTAANSNNVGIVGPDIWDVLPAGIRCSDISNISDGGVCTDPGDAGQPNFTGNTTRSALRWDLPDTFVIAPGASRDLTMTLTIPQDLRIATTLPNTVFGASYASETNREESGDVVLSQHYPRSNIDRSVPAADQLAPEARDGHRVRTEVADILKNVTSPARHFNSKAQAVIGEQIPWTVDVTIPKHSKVYQGLIRDPLPNGVTLASVSAELSTDAGASFDPAPPAFVASTDPSNPDVALLTFPDEYFNDTDTDHVVRLTVLSYADDIASNTHWTLHINRARLTSKATPTSAQTISTRYGYGSIRIVEPNPVLTKTEDVPNDRTKAGDTITYTLNAEAITGVPGPGGANNRPDLYDTQVIDCIPSWLNTVTVTSTPAGQTATAVAGTGSDGCQAGETTLTWNIGLLTSGTSDAQELMYTAVVDAAAPAGIEITNSATLTGTSISESDTPAPPVVRTYTSEDSTTVSINDGAISKSTSTPVRTVGDEAAFELQITIPAGANLYNTLVTDTVPTGFDPASLRYDPSTCENADGTSCTLPVAALPTSGNVIGGSLFDIAVSNQVRTLTLTYYLTVADIAAVASGEVLTNSATLGWDNIDGPDKTSVDDTNDVLTNPSSANVTVQEPTMTIAKTADATTAAPGDTINYTVSAKNQSGTNVSAAYNVIVTDEVPVGLVVSAGSISSGGTISGASSNGGGTITWTLPGPIAPGDTASLTYAASLADPPPTGDLQNTATLTEYQSRSTGGRSYQGNEASHTLTPALPHVKTEKTVVGGPIAYIGTPKGWRIEVTSDGDTAARDVDVVDTLPPNWTYDANSAQVSIGAAAPTAIEPSMSGQTLTWADLGDLAPGEQIVVTFTATPSIDVTSSPGVGSSVDHTNSAQGIAEDANGSAQDANGDSYSGPANTAAAQIHSADLAVKKLSTGQPIAGAPFSWTIEVTNNGDDNSVGPITVLDSVPSILTSVSASGTGWDCSGTTTITCTRNADLAAGDAAPVITVTGTVPATTDPETQLTNKAVVTGTTYDPDNSNNSDSDTKATEAEADLVMAKSQPGDFVAGTEATYLLEVSNNGLSEHRGLITVTDEIPAGVEFVSVSGTGWSCSEASGSVTCTRADSQLPGPLPSIEITVRVDSTQTEAVTNTATVAGTTADPDDSNNTDNVTITPTTSADLALTKTSTTDFVPGDAGTYEMTVSNSGPSAAQSVQFTDQLPEHLTFTDFASIAGNWTSCTVDSDNLLTCTLAGNLDVDETVTVQISVDIDPAHVGSTTNSATVSSSTKDPIDSNNTGEDNTASQVETDLTLAKTHPSGTATAGTSTTWTLTVTNDGLSNLTEQITLSDDLPAGVTFASATGADCAPSGQVVNCTSEQDLAVGETLTVTITVDVDPSTVGSLRNAASVSTSTDPDPSNNSAENTIDVETKADLSLVKATTGANPVLAGDSTQFEITVTNDGPSTARNVTVSDLVPNGMTITAISGTGWNCTVGTGMCERNDLTPGTAAVIAVTVDIDSSVTDTELINAASVRSSTDDPTDNNSAESPVAVDQAADLSIEKTHPSGSTDVAGEPTSFEMVVTNDGPSDAAAPITITDTLPAGLTYVAADAPWSCTNTSGVIECTLAAAIVSGADAPKLTLHVNVNPDTSGTTQTNEASVSSPTPDPSGPNNDSVDVDITSIADLSITKTASAIPATVGETTSFTIDVRNDGPSDSRKVVVTDTLPDSLTPQAAAGTGWTCTITDQVVTCELDDPLAPGADADQITIEALVTAGAYPSVSNTADVDAETTDPNFADNTSEAILEVDPRVDLSITKENRGELRVGTEYEYVLTIENAGPTDDPGEITVVDALPAELEFVSAAGEDWDCSFEDGNLTCVRDGLEMSEPTQIVVTVLPEPEAFGTVTNTASVSSPSADDDPTNNQATDEAEVAPLIQLSMTKTAVKLVNGVITWKIEVTNEGPNDTQNTLKLTDPISRKLEYVRASGGNWDCAYVSSVVRCDREATLAAGKSTAVIVVTKVRPGVTGEVTNAARLSSTGADEVDTNNASVKGNPIVSNAQLEVPPPPPCPNCGGGNSGAQLPDTGGPQRRLLGLSILMILGGLTLMRMRRGGQGAHS